MNEELEFILGAVALIVMAGLLSFGFGGLSGFSTKDVSTTTVEVSPEVVSPGETINININTDAKFGVHSRFSICRRALCLASGDLRCSGYGCRDNVNVDYRLPSDLLAGEYYVRIKEFDSNDYIKASFTIE